MNLIYTILMHLLAGGFRLAALVHPKARLWVSGRRGWRQRYAAGFQRKGRLLWVHAASLGEFEQGRPVIEAFRSAFPDWQIVLTFFSPSGYEVRKNYAQVDAVWYLPADTPGNARDFLDLIRPDAAVFVKYEFWANYLFELRRRGTPTLLISALFRPGQPFFRWYGGLWRAMLQCFSQVFVQNQASADLLQTLGFDRCIVAGDTRVDRVLGLAATAPDNAIVRDFCGARRAIVLGSSWEADEDVLLPVLQQERFRHYKIIIAPHEPTEKHLNQLLPKLSRPALRYSQCLGGEFPVALDQAEVLIIDNIGMLNTLYRYGALACIGGGFGKGIHNTLEPAAFGLPVVFGPRFEKFEEARQFVARGGAFPVTDSAAFAAVMARLQDEGAYQNAAQAVRAYLEENRGATEKVMAFLRKIA